MKKVIIWLNIIVAVLILWSIGGEDGLYGSISFGLASYLVYKDQTRGLLVLSIIMFLLNATYPASITDMVLWLINGAYYFHPEVKKFK